MKLCGERPRWKTQGIGSKSAILLKFDSQFYRGRKMNKEIILLQISDYSFLLTP